VSRCTLEFGGELVAVADGATLDAEYALFDAGDIELSATAPGTIREMAYRTTAREARSRLAQQGATRELAEEAATVVKVWLARAFARGVAVRRIVDKLAAAELLDGRTYDASIGRYVGAWLELPELTNMLSSELEPSRAATNMQALHLAALLTEYADDDPVVLWTAEVTSQRRPGERTYKRLVLERPQALVQSLARLRRTGEREGPETGPGRQEILGWLRARARRVPAASARFADIEAILSAREAPTRGPLAEADLWALETRLSLGETAGVVEQLDALEGRRGRLPATAYLRARLALMTRTEEPGAVADRVSALSTSMSAFHELQLLAAQAWAAAGDVRRAHAFARDLLQDTTACDTLRMSAREVLDATVRTPTAPEAGLSLIPKPPLAPSNAQHELLVEPRDVIGVLGTRERPHPNILVLDVSIPPFRFELRADRPLSNPPERAAAAENAETLSAPAGMQDEVSPHDEPPRTPPAARLFCTHLTRELARELRMRHSVELRCDVDGLELAQRYLREAIAGDEIRTAEEEREVMRNGAFLGELFSRRLGGRWIDLEHADPARWAMLIPSRARPTEVCRTWPFARVLRFVALKHKERDLVSHYLQIEAHAR
jgi:hypothetical protein